VRLSKIGNARLRKALYFPAIRCRSFFQRWVVGLRQWGKSKMAVIGAVMRKLLHLVYGVLKTGKACDPEWT
jgi:transposase